MNSIPEFFMNQATYMTNNYRSIDASYTQTNSTRSRRPMSCHLDRNNRPASSRLDSRIGSKKVREYTTDNQQQTPLNYSKVPFTRKIELDSELERKFRQTDPKFSLIANQPHRKPRINTKMLQFLSYHDKSMKKLKTKFFYQSHHEIIRKLKRIYQDKKKGETEQSDENLKPMEKQKQKNSQMKKRKMSLGSMKPQIRLRRNRSNSSVDIEEKIKSLKKSRSPLKGLLSGYKNVINHFYPKFDHQMQKIIDFYKEDSLSSKNDLQSPHFSNQESHFNNQIQISRRIHSAQPRRNSNHETQKLTISMCQPTNMKQKLFFSQEMNGKVIEPIKEFVKIDAQLRVSMKQFESELENNMFQKLQQTYKRKLQNLF